MASEPVNALERRTFEIGRSLFEHMKRAHRPWHRAWWDTLAMNGLLGDPAVKVQLFRFIDALPSLRSPREVVRHLDEYLAEAGDRVPWLIKGPLALAPPGEAGDRMVASLARHSAEIMAKRFIAGSNPAEALVTVKRMRHERLAFTADLLGEAVTSEREADAYRDTCLELLTGLHGALAALPEIPIIDRDHNGPIPRVNLSLKLSSLTAQFDPLAEEATSARVLERLRPILRQAREVGAFVNVDMEQYSVVALTHAIFRQVLAEPGFADWDQAGIVVQAYLRGAMETLEGLRDWVETRGVPITIRLVKGAYWDYEVVHARQNEWPIPVYTKKWETDLSYERCARFLIDHREPLHPAFGSHNLRSLAAALAMAEEAGAPAGAIEVQVLHGMGAPIARSLVREGRRVRVYMPYGAMLPGMAYLVRRLLENTSNESFLKASASGGARIEDLLQNPEETGRMSRPQARERAGVNGSPEGKAPVWPAFANEPPLDFSQSTVRTRFREVLANVANNCHSSARYGSGARRFARAR
jgi:RHH-type proline utilization regulon transcriptional repressor/proline dehydrogenase/delta 1-pyrroline-5-carboxylate dehydrogenase